MAGEQTRSSEITIGYKTFLLRLENEQAPDYGGLPSYAARRPLWATYQRVITHPGIARVT